MIVLGFKAKSDFTRVAGTVGQERLLQPSCQAEKWRPVQRIAINAQIKAGIFDAAKVECFRGTLAVGFTMLHH